MSQNEVPMKPREARLVHTSRIFHFGEEIGARVKTREQGGHPPAQRLQNKSTGNCLAEMASYLPPHDGLLPLFILFVGVTAIGNAIQSYTTLSYTRRLYAGQPASSTSVSTKTTKITTVVSESTASPAGSRPTISSKATAESHTSPATPLSSRTFGTWTMAVGIVRIFAAYHIDEPAWYQMQLITNLVGIFHFSMEAFVYGTARPSGPWFAPIIVALVGTAWSLAQYGYYVK